MAATPTSSNNASGRPAGLFTWVAVGLVLVVIAVLVVIKVSHKASKSVGDSPTPSTLVSQLTTIPASVYDAVGTTSSLAAVAPPVTMKGQALYTAPSASTGKKVPALIYVGAEYCPYCAAERWSVITALSRFGTFTGLQNTVSSSTDVYPSTQSFSFANATYSSPYIAFNGYEMYSNQVNPATNYWYTLNKLPKVATLQFGKYDTPAFVPGMPAADKYAFPFMTIADKYLISGSQYTPALLHGVSRDDIASGLNTSSSPITQAILASANELTAAICKVTNNAPAAVCTSPGVVKAAATL